jgi:hypothetical protein
MPSEKKASSRWLPWWPVSQQVYMQCKWKWRECSARRRVAAAAGRLFAGRRPIGVAPIRGRPPPARSGQPADLTRGVIHPSVIRHERHGWFKQGPGRSHPPCVSTPCLLGTSTRSCRERRIKRENHYSECVLTNPKGIKESEAPPFTLQLILRSDSETFGGAPGAAGRPAGRLSGGGKPRAARTSWWPMQPAGSRRASVATGFTSDGDARRPCSCQYRLDLWCVLGHRIASHHVLPLQQP